MNIWSFILRHSIIPECWGDFSMHKNDEQYVKKACREEMLILHILFEFTEIWFCTSSLQYLFSLLGIVYFPLALDEITFFPEVLHDLFLHLIEILHLELYNHKLTFCLKARCISKQIFIISLPPLCFVYVKITISYSCYSCYLTLRWTANNMPKNRISYILKIIELVRSFTFFDLEVKHWGI